MTLWEHIQGRAGAADPEMELNTRMSRRSDWKRNQKVWKDGRNRGRHSQKWPRAALVLAIHGVHTARGIPGGIWAS